MEPSLVSLVSFAIAAGLLVLTGLLALATRAGERGWGGSLAGRLERLSSPAWAGRRGGRGDGEPGTPLARTRAGRHRYLAPLAAVFAGTLVGLVLFDGVVPAVFGAGVAVWAWGAKRAAAQAAAGRRFHEELESALEAMVASFKAGRSLVRAIEDSASQTGEPIRSVLAAVGESHRAGTPLAEAIENLRSATPEPEAGYLAACLGTHLRTGGDVTVLLVNLGGVIRERRHLVRDLSSRTSEARSTATLIALLPPGLAAYILWAEPTQLSALFASPFGVGASVFALASWLSGVLIIRGLLDGLMREIGEG